jgi:3-dehydroquinate dehydratase-2
VLVLNGPNLNLLGTREPAIYGRETLAEINAGIAARAAELGVETAVFQSNHEGALIDRLHRRDFDAVIVNAAGLTHTSVSLRDALLGIERPFVEVHLSDPATREPFRRINFLEDIAVARFVGLKAAGYRRALEELARRWEAGEIAARAGAGTAADGEGDGDGGSAGERAAASTAREASTGEAGGAEGGTAEGGRAHGGTAEGGTAEGGRARGGTVGDRGDA